jgi:hypothetical protein
MEALVEARAARWSGPLAVAAAAVACVAVAIAAAGEPMRGARGSTVHVSVTPLLALVPIAASLLLGFISLRMLRRTGGVRLGPRRRKWLMLVMLVPVLLGALAVFRQRPAERPQEQVTLEAAPNASEPPTRHTAWPIWLGVAAGGVLALVGVASRRRSASAAVPAPPADDTEVALQILDDSADDLAATADPRRAVIAAYARLLDGLQDVGAGRRPAEAPFEYATRVLGQLGVRPAPLERLTMLFAEARFSTHEITEPDRASALDALVQARDDLTKMPT